MATYRVVYEIDVEADSKLEAAREAIACIRDPNSMEPIVGVSEWKGGIRPPDQSHECEIDLSKQLTPKQQAFLDAEGSTWQEKVMSAAEKGIAVDCNLPT